MPSPIYRLLLLIRHIREKVTEAELNHFIEKYKEQYSVQKDGIKPRTGKSEADERNPTNSCEK